MRGSSHTLPVGMRAEAAVGKPRDVEVEARGEA